MLKRVHHFTTDLADKHLEKQNKNIIRLIDWMLNTIPPGFYELAEKEKRIFENVSMLTSSADFIKAIRNKDLIEASRILKINVLFIEYSSDFVGESHKINGR